MKKLKTILTNYEADILKAEKKSIIRGFRRIEKMNPNAPKDEYKQWLNWRLIAMIERIDRRTVQETNLVLGWKKSK